MSGIVSPLPDGCLVGVYGHDGIKWVKLSVDSNGQLNISTGNDTVSRLTDIKSTINSLYDVLRLNNLVLYSGTFSYTATASGNSGNIAVDTSTVPQDKILIITSCGLLLASGSAQYLQLAVSDGTNIRPFIRKLSPTVNDMLTCPPFVMVPPTGFLRGVAVGVGNGTSINIYVIGYYVNRG